MLTIPYDGLQLVGRIPQGVVDLQVKLASAKDVDIQVYDERNTSRFPEGKAVIAWCKTPAVCNWGDLNGPGQGSTEYNGLTYAYSGYNGDGTGLGNEWITISGTTNTPLSLWAFAYEAGTATVTYSYMLPASATGGERDLARRRKRGRGDREELYP